MSPETIQSFNPTNPSELVGEVEVTDQAAASAALDRAVAAQAEWKEDAPGRSAALTALGEAIADHVDIVEIGPDNMQNFVLLKAVGASGLPVILHRGSAATIDEWLLAAEYILDAGNDDVVLCERGSRGFDPRTTETLD
ncbi:MAG: hypothetical protein ACERKT_09890, partial [Acidobacteriota bacterium]